MEQKIKYVNRTIRVSEECRCKYKDATSFDILQVNITFNGIATSYQVDAKHLSRSKDSIYFYPTTVGDKLSIEWNKEIAPYIHKI